MIIYLKNGWRDLSDEGPGCSVHLEKEDYVVVQYARAPDRRVHVQHNGETIASFMKESQARAYVDAQCPTAVKPNATFLAFKPSGKWKYEGRGFLTEKAMMTFDNRKAQVLEDNGGNWPGCSNPMDYLHCVVVPDEAAEGYVYPLMFPAKE